MSIEAELQQYALSFQSRFHHDEASAQKKKAKLEEDLLALEATINSLGRRSERVTAFFEELRSRLVCPSCFIQEEVWAEVVPIPSDSDREDLFRCRRCRTEFTDFV